MSKKVYIHTFGCQMNVHDSEKMLGVLEGQGCKKTDSPANADIIIYNTCSIRQKAEQKFYSELGRIKSYKKRRKGLKIVVAGCIAQQEGKNIFKKAPHVDFVLGPQNIQYLSKIDGSKCVQTDDNPEIALTDLPASRKKGVSAWVTIMYGCNNFCSYCIVPYTRGREKSRPSENILEEVSGLALEGFKEITLLGQNVNSYISDVDFPGLLRKLDRVGGIERIRFVTSHPKDLSDSLVIAMKELKKVCEHIHLPLQSGSDRILKKMNRQYSFEDYRKKVQYLRKNISDISITTDIIAGFPGETAQDHSRTVNALKEIEYDGIFAFKYSRRPGTVAEVMEGQVEEDIKSERLNEILGIQDKITETKNRALENTILEVMIEGKDESDEEKISGRTRTNKIVTVDSLSHKAGDILNIKITKGRKHSLAGNPVL